MSSKRKPEEEKKKPAAKKQEEEEEEETEDEEDKGETKQKKQKSENEPDSDSSDLANPNIEISTTQWRALCNVWALDGAASPNQTKKWQQRMQSIKNMIRNGWRYTKTPEVAREIEKAFTALNYKQAGQLPTPRAKRGSPPPYECAFTGHVVGLGIYHIVSLDSPYRQNVYDVVPTVADPADAKKPFTLVLSHRMYELARALVTVLHIDAAMKRKARSIMLQTQKSADDKMTAWMTYQDGQRIRYNDATAYVLELIRAPPLTAQKHKMI